MIQKVLSFVEKNHMLKRGDHVVAGVSGGADSVCLLLVLHKLQESIPFFLEVVHIEHGIRGAESLRDQHFVEDLCQGLGISCHCYSFDVTALAKEEKMTVEEAGRKVRYDTFRKHISKESQGRIAIAHNQNDCAETVLFHLARGTGLKGLEGIAPTRDEIIRPLLCVSRQEIEAYLTTLGQPYCTDSTNLDTEYARNKIRHQVLPALNQVNEKAVEHIWTTARRMAQIQDYMEQQAEQIARKAREQTDHLDMDRSLLLKQPPVLRNMVLHSLLARCAGSRKDITNEHIESLALLVGGQVGKKQNLPYGMLAEIGYEDLRIWKTGQKKLANMEELPINVLEPPIPGTVELEKMAAKLVFQLHEFTDKNYEIPRKAYTKWFDYDKIRGNLQVRTRRTGDYFVIDEAGKHQTFKKYLINEKVPSKDRDHIIVLADQQHIVWAVGHRISEDCKVTKETKTVLEVQFIMEESKHE